MRKILVPVDFSPCSTNAVQYAAKIAETFNAEIYLLHVCHFPINSLEAPAELLDNDKILQEAESEMLSYKTKLNLPALKLKHIIIQGLAADVISEYATQDNFDVVVMGTKGVTGLEKTLLGSIASSVLDKTSCPVIVVPIDSVFSLSHICFATDYKETNFARFDVLFQLCKMYSSTLSVVHATAYLQNDEMEYDLMHTYEAAFKQNTGDLNIAFHLLTGENEIDTIDQYILQNNCNLLVVSPEQRGFISRIFNPSFTKELVCHSKIPILAIPV